MKEYNQDTLRKDGLPLRTSYSKRKNWRRIKTQRKPLLNIFTTFAYTTAKLEIFSDTLVVWHKGKLRQTGENK